MDVLQGMVTRQALILLAALTGGLAVALLAGQVEWRVFLAPPAGRAVARYRGIPQGGAFEKVGDAALKRFPGLGTFLDLPRHLRWLALTGRETSPAAVVGLAVSLLLGGLALWVLLNDELYMGVGLVGFVLPFVWVRSQANEVKRQVERSLPELAAILAAEMAAGNPPDRALERAASWRGPLAAVVREALQTARRTGRPVFGRGAAEGVLVRTARRYGLPSLYAFATQVDMAARRGAAGQQLMLELANTLIAAYRERALKEAEALDNKLAVPAVVGFFFPFLLLILGPLLIPFMEAL